MKHDSNLFKEALALVAELKGTSAERKKPCTCCGKCCKETLCAIAYGIYRVAADKRGDIGGPCPLLRNHSGRYVCGLLTKKAKDAFAIKDYLYIGQGCPNKD